MIKINDKERKVLGVMAEDFDDDMNCRYFRSLASMTKLTIPEVRRAARSLTKKGLAEYHRGLFDEDGMVAGSGYCATKAGVDLIAEIERKGNQKTLA